MRREGDLFERKCAVCGKVFVPAAQHVLHARGRWACKPTCYLALKERFAAEDEAKRERRKSKVKGVDRT